MNKEFDEKRRAFLVKALGAGVFASTAGSSLLVPTQSVARMPRKLPLGKSIYKMRGEVLVDGKKADKNTFISASSLVETRSDSYVVFAIGTDAHILRENSNVQFEGKGILEEGMRLLTGKLLSVFGKRRQAQRHTMKTTTATIGIRGTGVYAESNVDSTYLCTCYGTVDLYANSDGYSAERVKTTYHDSPRFILADGKRGRLIVPAPMFNHEDEELAVIEALVGREAPFSGINGYNSPRKGY